MSTFNMKRYKLAKVLCTDLEMILKVVNLTIRGLDMYRPYTPVKRILNTLKEEKIILEAHLSKNKEVKKNKGME